MKTSTWILVVALLGCGDKDGDSAAPVDGADGATDGTDGTDGTADGTDGTSDGTDGTSGPDITVQGISISECGDVGSARLTASLATATSVSVTHEGFEANCCADLAVDVSPAGSTLTMVYTDSGDPCDCTCAFDLAYTLQDVPSGTWTVTAGGGVSDAVTVP